MNLTNLRVISRISTDLFSLKGSSIYKCHFIKTKTWIFMQRFNIFLDPHFSTVLWPNISVSNLFFFSCKNVFSNSVKNSPVPQILKANLVGSNGTISCLAFPVINYDRILFMVSLGMFSHSWLYKFFCTASHHKLSEGFGHTWGNTL